MSAPTKIRYSRRPLSQASHAVSGGYRGLGLFSPRYRPRYSPAVAIARAIDMKLPIFVPIFALLFAVPAFADCGDDACRSIQKILEARSGNFSKIKGKPGLDPRGDPVWEGTQAIAGLINTCSINKRGEGSHYEYRCDSQASHSSEKAKNCRGGQGGVSVGRSDARLVRGSGCAGACRYPGISRHGGLVRRLREKQGHAGQGREYRLRCGRQHGRRDGFRQACYASRPKIKSRRIRRVRFPHPRRTTRTAPDRAPARAGRDGGRRGR